MLAGNDGVAIIGWAQAQHDEWLNSLEMLVYSTARTALADAGVELGDIDAVVTACSDQIDGRAISSMLTSGPAGGHLRDETNVASSSAHALVMGWLSVLSGQHRCVLVSSWGMASEGDVGTAERITADPYFERDLPLDDMIAMALQAQAHRAAVAAGAEGAAAVVAKNLGNASTRAGRSETVTAADVMRSELVTTPLRRLEVAPRFDGAVSLVLASPAAVPTPERAVGIRGVGWAADGYRLAERDLIGLPHLARASAVACERAGIGDVREEVDFLELHDYCGDAELLACAAVGLTDLIGATEIVLDGGTGRGGRWPVNLSGGSLAGDFPFGGVLRRVADAAQQIRGEAGAADLAGSTGLVQMSTGFAGQFQTVVVLDCADGVRA